MKDKLIGWWMCIVGRLARLSSGKQFICFTILFIIPAIVALVLQQTSVSVLIVIYIVLMWAFIIGGYRMVGNGNRNSN